MVNIKGITIKNDFTKEQLFQQDHVKFLITLREKYPEFDPLMMRLSVHPPFWTRWMALSELFEEKNYAYLMSVNQRQIYPNEVVVDCDAPTYERNLMVAKDMNPEYVCVPFFSGGKGIHLSYFFDDEKGYLPVLTPEELKRWKIGMLHIIDHNEVRKYGFIDAQKCDEKVTINLEFAFNRKEQAKKKVPLIPFEPTDPLPLNKLDYELMFKLKKDRKEVRLVPRIDRFIKTKVKTCAFLEYCLANPLKDFRKRAPYYLAARLKRSGTTEDESLDILEKFALLNKDKDDKNSHKNLTHNYLRGVNRYVYANEKNKGCSSLVAAMKDSVDLNLLEAVKNCGCRRLKR